MLSTRVSSTLLLVSLAAPAAAQAPGASPDRPFLFSVSTPRTQAPHATVHVDTGFGEHMSEMTDGTGPEQRFGIQASLGRGFTLLARVGIADSGTLHTSQQGELLYSVLRSPLRQGSLAVGVGMRHESAGVNVLLGRIAAGRMFNAWRVDGNALFEKPFSSGRDAVDLITSAGLARRVLPSVHVGVEMIGEDLEGFWEAEEAEGGARLLIGPSLRVAPPAARWQLSVAGGPVVHATRTTNSSDASRSLARSRYAIRLSLAYGF